MANKTKITATAGYSETATVAIKTAAPNEQTLLTTIFNNSGGYKNIFKFLCGCLAGDYEDVDKYRPLRIKLFTCNDKNVTPAAIKKKFEDGTLTANDITAVSGIVETDTRATITEEQNGNYSVTFHFLIPGSYFSPNSDNAQIIMFYASKSASALDDNSINILKGLATYYLCATDDKTWNAIPLSELASGETNNLNLIIDWKMSIVNINN